MCLCRCRHWGGMCMYVCRFSESPEDCIGSPGTGDIGSFKLSDMGAGNQVLDPFLTGSTLH